MNAAAVAPLTHRRRKAEAIAVLALIAPLPLWLGAVTSLAVMVAFYGAVVLHLALTLRGKEVVVPRWMVNVAAIAALALLVVDARGFSQQLIRGGVHLALFLLASLLFSMRNEREKWEAMLLVTLVFVAAMATSTHITIVLYLAAFTLAALWALTLFSMLADADAYLAPGEEQAVALLERTRPATRRFVAWAFVATSLAAIPLFFAMPRLRDPFVSGLPTSEQLSTGFSETVDLSSIAGIKLSDRVALRVTLSPSVGAGPRLEAALRLRGLVYDRFDGTRWDRRELVTTRAGVLPPGGAAAMDLHWAQIFVPGGRHGGYVFTPVGYAGIEADAPSVIVDEADSVWLPGRGKASQEYRVAFSGEPEPVSYEGERRRGRLQKFLQLPPDVERIRELAERVTAGASSDAERAGMLQSFLMREYDYTLALIARGTQVSLETFLFEEKRGHCEYYASAMTVMLRTLGVPARLVGGYFGAERNDFADYYVVRHNNAHAWVEAYIPESSRWEIFDPTPVEGRPLLEEAGLARSLRELWDNVVFQWDRYVLTYGLYDQVSVIMAARDRLAGLRQWARGLDWRVLWQRAQGGMTLPRAIATGGIVGIAAILAATLVSAWRRRRRGGAGAPPQSAGTYLELLALLREGEGGGGGEPNTGIAGANVAPLAPGEARRRVAERFGPSAARVVDLYMSESFGGRTLTREELAEMRTEVRRLAATVKHAA